VANGVHAASALLVARPWWCLIRWTDPSSTASRSHWVTRRRRCCWAKAPHRHRVRSCTRATIVRRCARAGVPPAAGDSRRCAAGARAFVRAPAARVGHRAPAPQGRAGRATTSQADGWPGGRPGRRRSTRAREAGRPRARAPAPKGRRLGRSLHGALPEPRDVPDGSHTPVLILHAAADRHVWAGAALGAPWAAQTGRAGRRGTGLHPAQERLHGQSTAHRAGGHDRRLPPTPRGPRGRERGPGRRLVLETQRLLPLLPGRTPVGPPVSVQPAALLQVRVEEALLQRVRVPAVRDRLTQVFIVSLKQACCQAGRALQPPPEAGGLLAPFL
jgi:hypothetical protein